MTQKEELQAAQSRIEELDGTIATHASAIEAKDTEISGLVAQVAELTNSSAEKDNKIAVLEGVVTAHEGVLKDKATEITALTTEVATLKSESKSADEKAREIAASKGANLPAKKPEAGNKTTEQTPAGTARERLAAHTNAQLAGK